METESSRQILARNVRLLRAVRNMSQEELAKAAGDYSQTGVSRIEQGHRWPEDGLLDRIASAMGVTARDLLNPALLEVKADGS